jgi:DNA ligase D-like protein (predicted ligase)
MLPRFIEPMLSSPGKPFDSDDYLFEIKWDGVRALAFIEDGSYRLVNRRRIAITERYPDFAPLAQLPSGTIFDGEMVVFHDGRPDFGLLQSRDHARTPLKVRTLARSQPATYIAFDLLYEGFENIMDRPLEERRERLERMVKNAGFERLVFSEAIVGSGRKFFEEAVRRNLEGMMAKRRQSRYLPGKRTDLWIKVKRSESTLCAIIGFVPKEGKDFRNLILATVEEGTLRYAGKVGTGFDMPMRDRLNELLWSRLRPKPLVPCKLKGKWVEPGLYCRVSCMERTAKGEFREPVFEGLQIDEGSKQATDEHG